MIHSHSNLYIDTSDNRSNMNAREYTNLARGPAHAATAAELKTLLHTHSPAHEARRTGGPAKAQE
jgi:hypothetical protein